MLLRAGDLYIGCLLWLFFPIGILNMLFGRDLGSGNRSTTHQHFVYVYEHDMTTQETMLQVVSLTLQDNWVHN